jgi:hypothetical protein
MARWADLPAELNSPTYSESPKLLENNAGASRIDREPQATAAVLDACAGLPLALRICAARLETRPSWSVRTLAERVSGEHRRLDALSVGDLAPRSTFAMSHARLPGGTDGRLVLPVPLRRRDRDRPPRQRRAADRAADRDRSGS